MRAEPSLKNQVLIDNDFITMRYYPDYGIIHHTIHKFIFGDHLKQMLNTGADYFERHQCTKWLSDDRNGAALSPEDMEWGRAFWEPRMFKTGWKCWAILMPNKILGKMTLQRVVEEFKTAGVTIEIFDDLQEAFTWLLSENN